MQIPTPLTIFAPWAYDFQTKSITINASNEPICLPDMRRVYINISTISGIPLTVSQIGFGTNVQQGGRKGWDQNGNFELTWSVHYILVQQALYLISSAYPTTLAVTEVYLAQETITRANRARDTIRAIEKEIKPTLRNVIITGNGSKCTGKS